MPAGPKEASRRRLLELDRGPGRLELGLGLFGVLLGDLLQHRLGGAVDQVLGLLQSEVGEGPHLLDHLDLLVPGGDEDDVELVLLLLCRRGLGGASRDGGGDGDRCRGGHAEALLELLQQLRELQDGHVGDGVEDLFFGGHGDRAPSQSVSVASAAGAAVSVSVSIDAPAVTSVIAAPSGSVTAAASGSVSAATSAPVSGSAAAASAAVSGSAAGAAAGSASAAAAFSGAPPRSSMSAFSP